jgi:hypothetical protein
VNLGIKSPKAGFLWVLSADRRVRVDALLENTGHPGRRVHQAKLEFAWHCLMVLRAGDRDLAEIRVAGGLITNDAART